MTWLIELCKITIVNDDQLETIEQNFRVLHIHALWIGCCCKWIVCSMIVSFDATFAFSYTVNIFEHILTPFLFVYGILHVVVQSKLLWRSNSWCEWKDGNEVFLHLIVTFSHYFSFQLLWYITSLNESFL